MFELYQMNEERSILNLNLTASLAFCSHTQGMQHVTYDSVGKRLAVHGVDYTRNIISDVIMDYQQVGWLYIV